MDDYFYSGVFAGVQLQFAFRHADTAKYFQGTLSASDANECAIRVPKTDFDLFAEEPGMGDNAYTEYSLSVYRASDALMPYDRFLFHAAAILWRDRAWLLAANSGTGKSTQLRHWMNLYPDEVRIINGDKPILHRISNDGFMVYPSPWKGKERWGDDSLAAPLGGIILLEQGKENAFSSLSPFKAARPFLTFFFSAFESESSVQQLCRLEEDLITKTPLWRLVNRGDEASAILTHDTLCSYAGGGQSL